MKIASGLISSMVMPRDESGASRQLVTGTCRTTGEVLATVSNESGSLLMERRPCGKASRGRFQAHLDGIPCGGPYTVTLACGGEHVTVGDVLVGELWILAGQSNMEGSGLITGTRTNENPLIRAYYMDDTWGMATEPICSWRLPLRPRTVV